MFFRSAVGALCAGLIASSAGAAERIEFMFPAPVQGKLSREMQKLVKEFNSSQDGVEVVGVFTGSYDDTKVKSQAAAEAGKPPAVVLMSANFATELAMNDLIVPMKELAGDTDLDGLMQEFWPAVRPNAYFNGDVYSIPFQNSTPILYYNKEHFAEAGITKAPETWAEWVDAAKKLTKLAGAGPDHGQWRSVLQCGLSGRDLLRPRLDPGRAEVLARFRASAPRDADGRDQFQTGLHRLLLRQGLHGRALHRRAQLRPRQREVRL